MSDRHAIAIMAAIMMPGLLARKDDDYDDPVTAAEAILAEVTRRRARGQRKRSERKPPRPDSGRQLSKIEGGLR